ncbi:16S rRNA (uracil(1498)-N(3))-methyltransferase [Paenibacillus sp. J2TS4]|uniref:16S rRNA (uracil(1498)-N(3))-methyltransferase n=1 Tax=Paenibacillus sp. J2TS4 TaxID=2807194 RepID=UPI001B07269D|nr:16S rRNA (uracil(1498)-N(3))-methyltransferase [Paenibacillus sp. J2TS4]GIP35849.1 ribosomal RNA small subunit methyltransferase E [Paenibacillus sp. J2TS4]
MQRYFIHPDRFTDDSVDITGEDAHHLVRVMRAAIGDQVICCDGIRREWIVRISSIEDGLVRAELVEPLGRSSEPGVRITIAQSLPKGDKMELVIQKGTEIGAASFLPFVSERTIVQYDGKKEAKRLERWSKIAKEAAEQAHRSRVPELASPASWKQLLTLVREADLALFCYEKEETRQLRPLIRDKLAEARSSGQPPRVVVIIGPEGGFTEREALEAEAAGCVPVSLGRRILRTETAAMVALTCILYEHGEMGG